MKPILSFLSRKGPSEDRRRGFALISTAALMAFVFGVAITLVNYVMTAGRAGTLLRENFSAAQLADAGIQKAFFCIKQTSGQHCGGTYGANYTGETNVPVGNGKFTTIVTGTATSRTVKATGFAAGGESATFAAEITTDPPTDGTSFDNALQVGTSGLRILNNAAVTGKVYSSGTIDCASKLSDITGDVYVSKPEGNILNCDIYSDAHADHILNAAVGGDAYYDDDITGTTVVGTKYSSQPTPAEIGLPTIDLDFWRDSAEYGGIHYGDLVPTNGQSIGPIKITGDLKLNQNINVTMTGPIWVNGTFLMENNSSITLAASFGRWGSAILVDDPANQSTRGKVDIRNGSYLYGSGNAKSHIMVVNTNTSMNDASPAHSVANNATGAVFYSLNGVLRLWNNSGAKALAGKRIFVDQNSTITFTDSNFAGDEYANSPPGVWRFRPGKWRQIK